MADKENLLSGLMSALANAGNNSDSPATEPVSGQLPRPTRLAVTDQAFFWEWQLDGGIDIVATYLKATEEWNVTVDFHGLENQTFSLEAAKNLGEALLSAYEWQQVWKLFFADYFMQSQQTPQTPQGVPTASAPYVETETITSREMLDVSLIDLSDIDKFGNETC